MTLILQNAVAILQLGIVAKISKLKDASNAYIAARAKDVLASAGFFKISHLALVFILCNDLLSISEGRCFVVSAHCYWVLCGQCALLFHDCCFQTKCGELLLAGD